MTSLHIVRPVVGRQVIIEVPQEWGDIETVDVILAPHATDQSPQEASELFKALEGIGFIGCISGDEQLATTYKQKLDFSNKRGEQS